MERHYFISVLIVAIAFFIGSNAQNIKVTVGTTQSNFTRQEKVNLILSFQNNGSTTLFICKWFLLDSQILDQIFVVKFAGDNVAYTGPVAKRRRPIKNDTISLAPGKTVSSTVSISPVYTMTMTGNYTIMYRIPLNLVVFQAGNLSSSVISITNNYDSVLKSNTHMVFVEGRPDSKIQKSPQTARKRRAPVTNYLSCSSSQQYNISQAIVGAQIYASASSTYMNTQTPGSTPRFTTWFGIYSSSNWGEIQAHFSSVNDAYSGSNTLQFDCTCTDASTFAYVYPTKPYTIYLCGAFWNSAVFGPDSMAGTLIHEMTHFVVVVGTSDFAYGRTNAQNLAQADPAKARMNADSHEYFAENTPSLQ